jgi:hypothetical protein
LVSIRCDKHKSHVEDIGWPRKSSGKTITAKKVAVDFALAFANNVRLGMANAIAA